MSTDREQLSESVLAALEELARNATPGPWEAGDVWVYTDPIYPDDRRLANVLGMKFEDEARQDAERERGLANAAHIAAADPSMVLALITEIRRLRAVFEKAHTPTDDEREALAQIVDGHADFSNPTFHRNVADAALAAGFRRTVQGEPCPDVQALLADADALVESWDRKGSWSADSPVGMVMRLVGALRAAGVVSTDSALRERVQQLVDNQQSWIDAGRSGQAISRDAMRDVLQRVLDETRGVVSVQGEPERATRTVDERDVACVEAWPGCHTFGYDPRCCRFPKSCSAGEIRVVLVQAPEGEEKP